MEFWWNALGMTPEMNVVLISLAGALNGRTPTRELMMDFVDQHRNIIPEHQFDIKHAPRTPKGRKPKLPAIYTFSIRGPRIDGQWNISTGPLMELLARTVIDA